MTDILEARKERKRKLLGVLQNIVRIMMDQEALGPSTIKVEMDMRTRTARITVPVETEDFHIWEEILHDGS